MAINTYIIFLINSCRLRTVHLVLLFSRAAKYSAATTKTWYIVYMKCWLYIINDKKSSIQKASKCIVNQ